MSFVIFLAGEVLLAVGRLSEVWAKCWLFVGRWTRKNLRVRRKAVNWRALWNSEREALRLGDFLPKIAPAPEERYRGKI